MNEDSALYNSTQDSTWEWGEGGISIVVLVLSSKVD